MGNGHKERSKSVNGEGVRSVGRGVQEKLLLPFSVSC